MTRHEIRSNEPRLWEIPGEELVVVRLPDRVVKIPARCPHRGAPLVESRIVGAFLECPWHGATFDLRTGRRLRGPECTDLAIVAEASNEVG